MPQKLILPEQFIKPSIETKSFQQPKANPIGFVHRDESSIESAIAFPLPERVKLGAELESKSSDLKKRARLNEDNFGTATYQCKKCKNPMSMFDKECSFCAEAIR